MKKVFSFLAGALSGALVGGVVVVLFTPVAGEELIASAKERWEMALEAGKQAKEERRRELEEQYYMMTRP